MEIIRITDQKNELLIEFYSRESDGCRSRGDSTNADLLANMALLLDALDTADGRSVFGATSHFRLRLLNVDNYRSPTIATIQPVIDGPKMFAFVIAYPMPDTDSPWGDAWIHGLAFDVQMAIPMIQTALKRSANAA